MFKGNCAACKVRQFRYGFRLDPVGYMVERNKVPNMVQYTVAERLWILAQVRPITIEG